MKRTLLAAILVSALAAVAAPVLAQPYGPDRDHREFRPGEPGGWDINRRLDWVEQRISRGRDDGSLDRRDAERAWRDLQSIRSQEREMMQRGHGRLDDRDRYVLLDRLDRLNDSLRWMRRNDERRPW